MKSLSLLSFVMAYGLLSVGSIVSLAQPTASATQPVTLKVQANARDTLTVYQFPTRGVPYTFGELKAGDTVGNSNTQGIVYYGLPHMPYPVRILNARLTITQNLSKFVGKPYNLGRLFIETQNADIGWEVEGGRLSPSAKTFFAADLPGTRTIDITDIVRQQFLSAQVKDLLPDSVSFRFRFAPQSNFNKQDDLADFTPGTLQITYAPVPTPAPPPLPAGLGQFAYVQNYAIYLINADGTGRRRLTDSGYEPAISPDGKQIAFADSYRGRNTGIFIVNADGTQRHRITSNGQAPAWSRDGQRIAYVGLNPDPDPVNRRAIITVDVGGSHPQIVATCSQFFDSRLAWSPQGDQIAFFDAVNLLPSPQYPNGASVRRLFFANTDGSGRREVALDDALPLGYLYNLAWSPDGSRIAVEAGNYGESASGHGYGFESIYTLAPDGTDVKRLTNDSDYGGISGEPTYSPDGRFLAFVSNRRGRSRIYLMNAQTGAIMTYIPNTEGAYFISFGPGAVPAPAKP
ncbi:MAG: PD40 domain-containing protein [Abitibacteriaceae bacterium]|nr:PD40 domain-containing protein [Abditibacteriaceae bacterium]MBV9864464.1 PD40 domain-containing protein [Abditibacteriaceae bacterium]